MKVQLKNIDIHANIGKSIKVKELYEKWNGKVIEVDSAISNPTNDCICKVVYIIKDQELIKDLKGLTKAFAFNNKWTVCQAQIGD